MVDRTEVAVGETLDVNVDVAGTSDPAVKWAVDGVENGNTTVGAISGSGAVVTYTAPVTEGEHVLAATSVLDATKSASVRLWIRKYSNPAVVTLSPVGTTVTARGTVAYTASVSGTASQTLTWFVDNIRNGNTTVGTLTSNGDGAHVLYTAPATGGAHSVKAVATNTAGATTSKSTTVTVQVPVVSLAIKSFSASPASITAGQGSILSWSTTGATQLSIAPSVGDVTGLASKNVSPATTTTYTLTARNASGQTVTAATTVSVSAASTAPSITSQPQSRAVTLGQTATFTVSAASSSSMSYQWRKNGTAISGARSSSYTTPATVASDNGARFSVVVTNTAGGATSSEATLTVNSSSQKKYYGFGSRATGGTGYPTVRVTNLNNSGSGSLREAISAGNRTIVFDVGGTINNTAALTITASNITIDGSTAPAPGITIKGHSLRLMNGAHNIILTSFRHRGGWDGSGSGGGDPDNLSIMNGCYNIVLDHLSLSNSYDENLGIWDGNYDITVQNCILGDGNANGERYAMLISNKNLRVSVYHNIFHNAYYRQPAVGWDTDGVEVAPSIVADVVNNLVWDYPTRGTTVYWGGKANVVGNHYFSSLRPGESNRAVNTESKGVSYASGNYSKDGSSVSGTTSTPFSVASYAQLEATSAAAAATFVKANAGCRTGGLDSVDISILGDIVP